MKNLASILLCAGRGTRMGATSVPKVCMPVAGVPAVNRTLRAFRECGVNLNIVVVGTEPGEVVRTVVAEFPDALFACQSEPLGTGHAVMSGAAPLIAGGYEGAVFVCAGDKVAEAAVFDRVKRSFAENHADLSLAVAAKPGATDMGRLVFDENGRPLGLVEAVELRLAGLMKKLIGLTEEGEQIDPERLRRVCLYELGAEKHLKRLGGIAGLLNKPEAIAPVELRNALPDDAGMVRIGARSITLDRALAGPPWMNESVYLMGAAAMRRGLDLLRNARHAGGEIYITDIVHLLAQDECDWRIDPVLIDESMLLFGFNTPEQLGELEERVRRHESARAGKSKI